MPLQWHQPFNFQVSKCHLCPFPSKVFIYKAIRRGNSKKVPDDFCRNPASQMNAFHRLGHHITCDYYTFVGYVFVQVIFVNTGLILGYNPHLSGALCLQNVKHTSLAILLAAA